MDLANRSLILFQKLRREAFGGRYHLPSGDAPERLSAFASAHHALALRHLDPALAVDELRTLYAACQTESGLVVRERAPAEDGATGEAPFIGPPVAAFATARLVLAGGEGLRDLLDRAIRELDAIWGERLPPDTDLPVILHPCESGTPESPLFDGVIESIEGEERRQELATLARSAAACRFDPDRSLRAGHAFVVEDPVFCGWFQLALEEVQRACEQNGDATAAKKLQIRSRMIAEAIAERLWWDEGCVFVARDRQRDEQLCVAQAGGLVPAASRLLHEDGRGRAALSRHLSSGSALFGARGISFNPIVRDRAKEGEPSPWRGNSASAVTQYWAHLGLLRAGRPADARIARSQLESLVAEQGFRGLYDAVSGEGGGAPDCPLPALALEMEASEQSEHP